MAAAEAKVDAKIRALNGLKAEVNGLLSQSNAKEAAEIDRLVKVFEGMKAKDAAPRLAALDDNVRIPIAAKMKERALSAIMAQMSSADAKKLTESLARRYSTPRPPPPRQPPPPNRPPPRRRRPPPPRPHRRSRPPRRRAMRRRARPRPPPSKPPPSPRPRRPPLQPHRPRRPLRRPPDSRWR